jgi:aspartyl-tRNA(Asn)/glutamyl-tRNA(Gln) amidotransferase subunit C
MLPKSGIMASMIDEKTVANLADLARIKISTEEAVRLQKELGSILDYVGALQKVDTRGISKEETVGNLRNIWRDDHEGQKGDRERILDEAPHRVGDYVGVKKVISYDE